uniref:B box-type domain-containing protein n=1 Tax=Scleropages formosus TaxID=113540 RepID=A0A8C9TYS4_SCLFO
QIPLQQFSTFVSIIITSCKLRLLTYCRCDVHCTLKPCPGYTCPLCCEIFPQFTLKKLGKGLCPVHGEPLKMFCVEEKMAICVVCAVSKEHRAHCLAPMEEILTQCEVRGVQDCRQKETDIDSVHGVLFKDRPCVVWHGGRYRIYSLSLHAHIVRETDCLLQCVQRERERLCSELHDDTQRLLALKQKTSSDLLQQGEVLQQQVASLRRRVGQEVQDPSALIKVSLSIIKMKKLPFPKHFI